MATIIVLVLLALASDREEGLLFSPGQAEGEPSPAHHDTPRGKILLFPIRPEDDPPPAASHVIPLEGGARDAGYGAPAMAAAGL